MTTHKTLGVGNGTLPLSLGWRGAGLNLTIIGGPFDSYPGRQKAFGVCVRAEQAPRERDVHLPIRDFDVPTSTAAVEKALVQAFAAAIEGRPVYVGCMGGWGRTGLFLALMAKAAGVDDPVGYVRKHYTPRAVETKDQQLYVDKFDVGYVQKKVRRTAWSARFPVVGGIIARLVA